MARNYAKGAARERQAGARLEADGWSVTRSAGSRSPHDLVACRAGDVVRYVQVKATARGPFAGFPPSERKELLAEASRAGAEAWLLWWPADRQGPRWMGPDDWP